MPEPQKLKGKDFLMFAEKGGLMVPICCSNELSISITGDTIEATKAPQSIWRSFIYGNLSYTLTTSGLAVIGEGVSFDDLLDYQISRTVLKWMARHDLGVELFMSGSLIINNITVTGANKAMMTMSMSATGDGPLNRTKTLQTFPLVDGEGNTVVDGEGNTVVVAPNQYGTSTPIDISVDC